MINVRFSNSLQNAYKGWNQLSFRKVGFSYDISLAHNQVHADAQHSAANSPAAVTAVDR